MNIVITGASKGIGYETAKYMSKIGNHTIVCISRTLQGLEQLRAECRTLNPASKIVPVSLDLSIPESIEEQLLPILNQHINSVDVLINNAGILVNKPFTKTATCEIESMFKTNFISPAILIKSLLPIMQKEAHVVSISSMGGFQGSVKFPGLAHYSASKAAIATLTECLAEELKETGIHFNALAIGAVNTEMLRGAFPGYTASVQPHEMGEFIADFAINKGRFFNGKIIPVSSTTP